MSAKKDAELRRFLMESASIANLTEGLSSMFVREGLPEDYDDFRQLIEETLLRNGCGAYLRDTQGDGKWVFGTCDLTGMPDAYGFGRDATVSLRNGNVYTFKDYADRDDVVVAFNSPLRLRDHNILHFGKMFTETDVSLYCQLINSRLHPMPVVGDEKSRAMVNEGLAAVARGELTTLLSANVLKDLTEMGMDPRLIEALDLTDAAASDHIQYISKFRDDLSRWFWQLYGHNSETNGKLAQQSVEEVASGHSISMILPETRLAERQREAARLKAKFGWNVTIEFSEPWKREIERIDAAQAEEGEANETQEDNPDHEGGQADDDADQAGGATDEV